jgi:hypothetical protein
VDLVHVPFHFDHLPTQPSPILFFVQVCCHKKQKIYLDFRKYHFKTIHSGSNFLRSLDSRVVLSVTAQSIFGVEPSVSAHWKGILFKKLKNNNNIFFLLGVTENGITQKVFLKNFKLDKLEEDNFSLRNY